MSSSHLPASYDNSRPAQPHNSQTMTIPRDFLHALSTGDAGALQEALTNLQARQDSEDYAIVCRALVQRAIDMQDGAFLATVLLACHDPLHAEATQCLTKGFAAGFGLLRGHNAAFSSGAADVRELRSA